MVVSQHLKHVEQNQVDVIEADASVTNIPNEVLAIHDCGLHARHYLLMQ